MSLFTIMTDTNSDLPDEFIEEHGVKMLPIPYTLDGIPHNDGRWQEISDKDFYNALGNGSTAATALINPEVFIDVFTEYAKRGESLLMLTLSSGLSGTYQNSIIALNDIKSIFPNCDIHVVDSTNAAGGAGLLNVLAVKKRAEGFSAGETAAWLEEKKHSCFSLFTVNDLMYLRRGGRLSGLSAVAGSIIGIKPLLNVAPDGTLTLKDKVRGRKASLSMLVSQMKRCLNNSTDLDIVLISHSNCLEDAQSLADMVRAAVKVNEIKLVMMSPVIGAHVGPGTLALFYESDMTREEYEAKFYTK